MNLQEQITNLVEEKISGTENFLVEVKVSTNRIAVYLDHPKGIKLEDCISVNRFLHEKLDDTEIFDTHELEVSSPGMDEPMKVRKQYLRRIGKEITVLMNDGIRRNGILKAASEEGIEIEETTKRKVNGKKEISKSIIHIPFNQIKEAKIIFSFDKVS